MVMMNLFAGQQWRCRHREQTYGHGGVGGAAGRKKWVGLMESSMETYTKVHAKSP